MTILERIIADKKIEVNLKKKLFTIQYLEQSPLFERETISLANRIRLSQSGVIAEHKRRSPSKSDINNSLSVFDVALGYEEAGACGMSVLTDGKYFGGSLEDLNLARSATTFPLLRKEFIIDEFQIIEAKSNGADAILLIASVLSQKEIKQLSECAKKLGLETLLEVHNKQELLSSLVPSINLLGVNNRNLETFEVSLETSINLAEQIPNDFVKVSESGIDSVDAIKSLKYYGFQGFLIGERFMKVENPSASAKEFIKILER